MIKFRLSNKTEDLECMLERMKVVHDVFKFNTTYQMGKKYQVWVEKHQDLLEELEFMVQQDLGIA